MKLRRVALTLFLATVLGSTVVSVPSAQEKIPLTVMELIPTPDPILSFMAMARDFGYFDKHGLTATIKSAGGGGPHRIQNLEAGEASIATSDIIAAMSATYQGSDVKTIMVPSARYGAAIVTHKKYSDVRQLKGKLWGVPSLGGSARFMTILMLKHFGLADKEIQWKTAGGTAQALPLVYTGQIDALTITPTGALLMKGPEAKDVHVLLENTAQFTPPFPNFVFVAKKSWLDKNPQAADRFVAAMVEMMRAFAADKSRYAQAVAKLNPGLYSPEEIDRLWKSLHEGGYWAVNGGINLAGVKAVLDLFFEVRGDRPNDKLSRAEDLFDTAPLKRVLDKIGLAAGSKDVPDWRR